MNAKPILFAFLLAAGSASAQAIFSTPEGLVGNNNTADQVHINGQAIITNPNGRSLMLQHDEGDSWLTFHDPGNAWFSAGIDFSNNRNFVLNNGGEPGAANHFIMTNSGRIGLGANPRGTFDVSYDISNGTLGTVLGRMPEGDNEGDGTYLGARGFSTQFDQNGKSFSLEHAFYGSVNSAINFFRGGGTTGGYLTFTTNNNTESLRITASGNVGIGTTAPDDKLTVKGRIHAQEIRVDLAIPAPDYVFEKNYPLTSLPDLERYITQHKHLPEIPSAKEMEANGIQLQQMNMLLLKKVEELTLHLIEANKKIEALSQSVEQLKSTK